MNSIQFENVPVETRNELAQHVNALRGLFGTIISDGAVTEIALERLNDYYKENEIPDKWLSLVRDEAFCQAAHFKFVDQESSTKLETYPLLNLAIKLGISPSLLSWMEQEVSTLALLNHIVDCPFDEIPKVEAESTILQPGENAFAELPATLIDESAMDCEHSEGLTGISFRMARGISYRIGEKKSYLLVRTEIPPVDSGFLILTDKRVIFSGIKTSKSFDIGSLFGTRIFADAIQFSTLTDQRVTTVGFETSLAAEYCGVVLSKGLNK